jgi:NADPH2:quinone reductase
MGFSRIVVSHFGGPENLKLVVEDKLPEPRANEMCVKILAAGVSFADILMREGGSSGILESWKNTIYSRMGSCWCY